MENKNFRYDKSLGQNFIFDKNLLSAIVSDAEVGSDDVVVEVGAGAGTLTRAIAAKAKKVVSFEIDPRLFDGLNEIGRECGNVEFIFDDILKTLPSELSAVTGAPFKVVANLPYYITTPVMFYFLENDFALKSMTLTVQREVAEKIVAKSGDPDYGVLTVTTALAGRAKITRIIPRTCFRPAPNVDSAVVRLDLYNEFRPDERLRSLVRKCFASRRKTLANNLRNGFGLSRELAENLAFEVSGNRLIRAQDLRAEDFVSLDGMIAKLSEDTDVGKKE